MLRNTVNKHSPSILDRSFVQQPLLTGFTIIDCLTPIGCGQRQLLIGDRFTGKTYLAKSIIANQKRSNRYFTFDGFGRERIFCVYVCIGLRQTEIRKLYRFFQSKGVA